MEQYHFSCYSCGYQVDTSGPYPFMLDDQNYRVAYPDPPPMINGRERGFNGLYAIMYCSLCDQQESVLVSQFYSPISQNDLEQGHADPAPVATPHCSGCGNQRLVYAQGGASCPRCRKGQLLLPGESVNPLQEQGSSPVEDEVNLISPQKEAKDVLRSYLLIAWIPLTILAIIFSLSAVTGSWSACDSPGPDLRQFCQSAWRWLSLLVGLGPAAVMILGGYLAVNDQRRSVWPMVVAAILAIGLGFLSGIR